MTIVRLAACAAFAAGIGLGISGTAPPTEAAGHPAHGHGGGHGSAGLATAAVSLTMEPEGPRAGERTALTLRLRDAAGEPLDLVTSHDRKLHAVIVSEDMAVLGHVHPEDFGEAASGGEARMYFAFPHGGRYVVGIDFATEAGPQAAKFTVDVAGPPSSDAAQELGDAESLDQVRLAPDDSYTEAILLGQTDGAPLSVSIESPRTIRAGEAVTFVYRFARDGAPINDLRPYLGAAMHLAAVKDDLTQFMHGHGEGAGATEMGHAAHGGDAGVNRAAGPDVTATLTFPEPGLYFLFGQAARGDQMLVSRFAVEVR